MPDAQLIHEQQQLLHTHRRTLAIAIDQLAAVGGKAYSSPALLGSIQESRRQILRIKQVLRDWGIAVADEPNDAEPAHEPPRTGARYPGESQSQQFDGQQLHVYTNAEGSSISMRDIYQGDIRIYLDNDLPVGNVDSLNQIIGLFNDAQSAVLLILKNIELRNSEMQHLLERGSALAKPELKARFDTLQLTTQNDLLRFNGSIKRLSGKYHSAVISVERSINQMFDVPIAAARTHRNAIYQFRRQLSQNEQSLSNGIAILRQLDAQLQALAAINPNFVGLNQAAREASGEVAEFAACMDKNLRLIWRINGMIDGLLQA